jgi:hypothetical protein
MKLIADRLLLSRACFLLGFTIVKLNKMKNKMKNVLLKFGLQHRRAWPCCVMKYCLMQTHDCRIKLAAAGEH